MLFVDPLYNCHRLVAGEELSAVLALGTGQHVYYAYFLASPLDCVCV